MNYTEMKQAFKGWGRVYGESLQNVQPIEKRWAEAMSRASLMVADLESTSTTKASMIDAFLNGVSEAFTSNAVL